jgi:hypothetical protein
MVEDAGGHGHTDAFPVPQAPEAGLLDGADPSAEQVDEIATFVPQPRDPGAGVVDPVAYAQAVGAHAAVPEYLPAPEAATEVVVESELGTSEPQAESAPDPLAGGLLAHLMSSVRGL